MSWLLTACHHLDGKGTCWAADCLAPGCLWTATADTPDQADDAATDHTTRDHPDQLDGQEEQ
jgi:hypothetical protein